MLVINKPLSKDILVKLSIVEQTSVCKYPLHRGNFAKFFMVMVIDHITYCDTYML